MNKFKRGDVVIWDGPNKLNPRIWDAMPEVDRVRYYSALGYGRSEPKLFVYLASIMDPPDEFEDQRFSSGHCVLVSLDDQKIETMRHDVEFRLALPEEL